LAAQSFSLGRLDRTDSETPSIAAENSSAVFVNRAITWSRLVILLSLTLLYLATKKLYHKSMVQANEPQDHQEGPEQNLLSELGYG
jgi:hypothetical protein